MFSKDFLSKLKLRIEDNSSGNNNDSNGNNSDSKSNEETVLSIKNEIEMKRLLKEPSMHSDMLDKLMAKNDSSGILYCNINIDDKIGENMEPYIETVSNFINDALNKNKESNENNDSKKNVILVHCQQGISRSASFVIAYFPDNSKYNHPSELLYVCRFIYLLVAS